MDLSLTFGKVITRKLQASITDFIPLGKRSRKLQCRKMLIRYKREILQDVFELLKVLKMPSPLVKEVTSYFSARDILAWSADADKTKKIIEIVKKLNKYSSEGY